MDFLPNLISRVSLSGDSVASLVFFAVSAFAAGASLVMFYHWRNYGMSRFITALTEAIYLVVAAGLATVAFYSLP